jgi:hypothetical protein
MTEEKARSPCGGAFELGGGGAMREVWRGPGEKESERGAI